MQQFTVEIWSDIVCPWCYIGEHRFHTALEQFAHRDDVTILKRSFQLDPSASSSTRQSVVDMLSSKYGVSRAEALRMEQQTSAAANAEGLEFHIDRVFSNTFDAHRLLHLAATHGQQEAMMTRLFAAHFANEQDIGDHATLAQLASEVGIDPAEARQMLASDAYADDVRADQQRAASFGIRGVPFFVINEQFGVSGGQPPEIFLDAMNQAWTAAHPLTLVGATAPADGCEDGVCAI